MKAAGRILQGRIAIERILGEGGMGVVYLARQENLGRRAVAVKQMKIAIHNPVERAKVVASFHAEAALLASLAHPGLVKVLDFFEERGDTFLVMEYVEGSSLETILTQAQGTFVPVHTLLRWADEICDVLEFLHSRPSPVLFRDLKPSNIMIDGQMRVRLIDFGIARVFQPDSKTATLLQGAGTPGFAPVEQYTGSTDPRSDIYSLGATLYQALTRHIPPSSISLLAGEESLAPPGALNPAVHHRLEEIILGMMKLKKEERTQTVEQVRRELSEIASNAVEATGASEHPLMQQIWSTAELTAVTGQPETTPAQQPTQRQALWYWDPVDVRALSGGAGWWAIARQRRTVSRLACAAVLLLLLCGT